MFRLRGDIQFYVFIPVKIISDLQSNDPMWYNALTGHLSCDQQKALQEVIVLADQRKAAAESKRIEQSGGCLLYTSRCV